MRLSLRLKTTVLFVVVASVPAVATGLLLVNINADAVKTTERALQAAVMAELASSVRQTMETAEDQLQAVAAVIEANGGTDPSLTSLRTTLQTATSLTTVRLVVPEIGSSDAITLDASGFAKAPSGLLDAALQVPIARGASAERAWLFARRLRGIPVTSYLVASLDLEALRADLERIMTSRFPGGRVRAVVSDIGGNVIAGYGMAFDGETERSLLAPLWQWLPRETPTDAEFALVGTVETERGSELAGAHVLADLDLRVVAWRPEQDAYAAVSEMGQRTIHAAFVSMAAACLLGWAAARRLVRPIEAMSHQAARIGDRSWTHLAPVAQSRDELGDLGRALVAMARRLRESEVEMQKETHMRAELSRYMSQVLVDRIVEGRHSLKLGGTRASVTVVFADVVRFTQLAEVEKPEAVVAWLNELFAILTEIVLRNGGVVDKFMGDSIMAFWGTLEGETDHAANALHAALDMARFVQVANRDWSRRFGRGLELGIGVNTGECIVGNLGSSKRMEYTVVGDAVNIAARLEKQAAPGQILVGEFTRKEISEDSEFDFVFVGQQRVAGRREMLDVYELVGE
jgi:class 3 adenylate cyclase